MTDKNVLTHTLKVLKIKEHKKDLSSQNKGLIIFL